jgi:hypothetical protein
MRYLGTASSRSQHRGLTSQVVGGACDSAPMNGADAFDLFAEISGRRVKRAIGIALLIGVLVFPKPTMGMFNWYVAQRAQALIQQFEKAIPTTPPATPLSPGPAVPQHRFKR